MLIPAYVDGDIRVQFLSDSLIRLEQRGPRGFEDRPTFTVINRKWGGVPYRKVGDRLLFGQSELILPARRNGLQGIQLKVGGKVVYTVGALPGTSWLPDPGKTGPVWALADTPRMVPPTGGPIPANLNGAFPETSGFDTGNSAPDLYLFITRDPKRLRSEYLRLTGPTALVPRYTFGYWDSRWYPYNETNALASIDEYRKRDLPLDLFVCDTDWRVGASKGYGVNTKLFPNMPGFLAKAHAKNVRIMFNDHPEPQASTALDPKETMYRWNGLTDLLGMGMDVWWYDRNWSTVLHEPMPGIPKETWGASLFHDITLAFRPEVRPLIMSNVDGIDNGIRNRPPHAAFHRYPITWTGDTTSNWNYLRRAVANGVDEGVIGMLPYVHEDAAGHMGHPSPELYTRFLQYCALSPVLRVHCTYGLNRYPWSFGPDAERATVEAIRFRYQLIPTLYSAAHRVTNEGLPILRRPDLEWPNLPEAASSRQYLLADDLLVSPVTDPAANDFRVLPGQFHAEYFPNDQVQGEPVASEEVSKIDVDWGQDSPAPAIPSDHFSVRWTGKIGPVQQTQNYTFATSTDDGVRLWINGRQVINQWRPLDSAMNTASVRLEAGKTYDVRMELQEVTGGANAHLLWSGDEPKKSGPMPWTFWCPPGKWVDPWTGQSFVGPRTVTTLAPLRRIPMLVRSGGTFFLGDPKVRYSDEQLHRPITIEAFPGESTTRTLIEDDGISRHAKVSRYTVTSARQAKEINLMLMPDGKPRDFRVRVHLKAGDAVKSVRLNGQTVPFSTERPKGNAQGLSQIFAARGGSVISLALPRTSTRSMEVRLTLR